MQIRIAVFWTTNGGSINFRSPARLGTAWENMFQAFSYLCNFCRIITGQDKFQSIYISLATTCNSLTKPMICLLWKMFTNWRKCFWSQQCVSLLRNVLFHSEQCFPLLRISLFFLNKICLLYEPFLTFTIFVPATCSVYNFW